MWLQTNKRQACSKRPLLILAVGNTFDRIRPKEGDFDDWISKGLGNPGRVLRMDARDVGIILPEPNTLAGILITGSHAMVTDHAPWSEKLADWLREGDGHTGSQVSLGKIRRNSGPSKPSHGKATVISAPKEMAHRMDHWETVRLRQNHLLLQIEG